MAKPRVLLEGWQDQYNRMRRSRARLDALSTYPEYDDAFFHAVQDAWHLKDWIQNDESDPAIDRSLHAKIVAEAHTRDAIRIIADLANCTKHLVQRDHPKAGAELDGTDAEAKMGTGQSKRWFRVRLRTGAMREGTELIDEAIAAWDELLKHHGFL